MADGRTDAELMESVRSGDRDAFGTLVDRYKNQLVNYLTRVTGNRDRAEELAQDAFVRLFQSAGSYREQGKLAPLLFRIATNQLRTEERRARRWRVVTALLPVAAPPAGASPQGELLRDETHRQLVAALGRLPLGYRVPLVLRDIEDWSYEEIARATGCPEGTVKSRISRARARLRAELAPYVLPEERLAACSGDTP